MIFDRVLNLVLLEGVEVFPTMYPSKHGVMEGMCESCSLSRVMMTVGFMLGKLGRYSRHFYLHVRFGVRSI